MWEVNELTLPVTFVLPKKTERKEQKALSKINLICFLVKTIFRRGMASGFPLVSLKPKTIMYLKEISQL